MTVDQHPSDIMRLISGLREAPSTAFGSQARIHNPQQLVAVLAGERGIISTVAIPIETRRIEGHNEIDWDARINFARQRFIDAASGAAIQA